MASVFFSSPNWRISDRWRPVVEKLLLCNGGIHGGDWFYRPRTSPPSRRVRSGINSILQHVGFTGAVWTALICESSPPCCPSFTMQPTWTCARYFGAAKGILAPKHYYKHVLPAIGVLETEPGVPTPNSIRVSGGFHHPAVRVLVSLRQG